MTSKKNVLFLKRHDFQKHHLFNKSNPHSMEILHDHMILYIVHAFRKRNIFVTLVYKNHVLEKQDI